MYSDKTENSSCDKTQKLILWQNYQTQSVATLNTISKKNQIETKFWNSNYNKTQKLKLLQSQLVTKLINSTCE